jgi:hypothetical protein
MAAPPFRPALWRARRRVRQARRQAGPHWPAAGTRRASTRVPSRRELPGGRRDIVLGHVLSCLCCSPDRRGQGRLPVVLSGREAAPAAPGPWTHSRCAARRRARTRHGQLVAKRSSRTCVRHGPTLTRPRPRPRRVRVAVGAQGAAPPRCGQARYGHRSPPRRPRPMPADRRVPPCSSDLRWASSVATSAGSGVWTTGTATHQRLARTIAYVDARTVDVEAQCDESITGPTVPGA